MLELRSDVLISTEAVADYHHGQFFADGIAGKLKMNIQEPFGTLERKGAVGRARVAEKGGHGYGHNYNKLAHISGLPRIGHTVR